VSTDPAANPPTPAPPGTPPAATDQPNWAAFNRAAVVAAIAGWALYAVVGVANLGAAEGEDAKHAATSRFMVGYLTGFIFWASLPVGAMALLMIHYLAKTSWGLLLTRPFEAATRTLPLLFVLFVPLMVAVAARDVSPYWWSQPEHAVKHDVQHDPTADHNKRDQAVETGKVMANRAIERQQAYQEGIDAAHHRQEQDVREGHNHFLSVPAYIGVGLALFLIWGALIYFLNAWGQAATDPDPRVVDRNLVKLSNLSGPGLIIFGITTTVAASQWVMSLEPGWSSTMFPVIYAVNQFLTCFTFCVALFLLIAGRPPFVDKMRPKFQLDMGTLMLAFTMFWSYTSFSQFMLVWIGNLPEEIPFYLKRSNYHTDHGDYRSGWWYVSAALIALHFALPFLLLLFRSIKLHPVRLRVVAVYLVVICAVDVTWWIAPSAPSHGNFPAWLMDVGAILGVGGIWALFFLYRLRQRPLFPNNQAFLLPEGHHHAAH
jgi:hypothetical protein